MEMCALFKPPFPVKHTTLFDATLIAPPGATAVEVEHPELQPEPEVDVFDV
jgi:hypothetical protein